MRKRALGAFFFERASNLQTIFSSRQATSLGINGVQIFAPHTNFLFWIESSKYSEVTLSPKWGARQK
jgi:hypothetical protein